MRNLIPERINILHERQEKAIHKRREFLEGNVRHNIIRNYKGSLI